MPLSRDYSYKRFVTQAFLRHGIDNNNAIYVTRFNLVDSVKDSVVNLFYDLVGNAYMTAVTLPPDTVGRYSSSGTGTWTASSKQLTHAGMNSSFTAQDVGKIITLRISSQLYIGTISQFISATVVVITGFVLPTTNQTVDYVEVIPTSITTVGNTAINISTLRLMRSHAIKMYLESTSTPSVDPVSLEEYFTWQPQADKNANRIVWAYSGDELLLAKGNNLSAYGTFTLHYPRIPDQGTLDAQNLDIPDGAFIDICLTKFDMLIAEMTNKPIPDRTQALTGMIQALYASFGREASLEAIREKVQALA